jgi:hypothetical protein
LCPYTGRAYPVRFIPGLKLSGAAVVAGYPGAEDGAASHKVYIKKESSPKRWFANSHYFGIRGGTNSGDGRLMARVERKFDMRYSVLLLPLAAVGLAGCVAAGPPPTTTTTYVTPGQTTTYVVPGSTAYGTPQQSTSTTYINGVPQAYAPGTQTTTTVRPVYWRRARSGNKMSRTFSSIAGSGRRETAEVRVSPEFQGIGAAAGTAPKPDFETWVQVARVH